MVQTDRLVEEEPRKSRTLDQDALVLTQVKLTQLNILFYERVLLYDVLLYYI